MSWKLSTTDNKSWTCICSSSNGNIMYAGTNDGYIYKSTDSGGSFPTSIQQGTNIVEIACNQSGINVLALNSNHAVYYSTNSGSTYNTFSSVSFPFVHIAMTNNSPPRLFGIVSAGTGYQSTNNSTWSLMLSSSSGPNSYICCGPSVTSSAGNIYINHNNTDIYYSNNGGTNALSPFPSKPLKTSVSCGKVICAQSASNNVMTISGSNINYNSSSGAGSYSQNTLTNNLTDIASSYDASVVTVADIAGNIYQSTSGPSSSFTLMSGYPSSLTFTGVTSNSDGSILAATSTSGIYFFNLNETTYNFLSTLPSTLWSGNVIFNLTLSVDNITVPSSITGTTGTITYPVGSGLTSPSNVTFVSSGSNQLISNTSTPYFGTTGFTVADNTNSLSYNILQDGSVDAATGFGQGTIDFTSESLTNSCLLKGSKILTEEGYKNIEDIKIGEYVISDKGRKIKVEKIYKNIYEKNSNFMPYVIQKNFFSINEPFEDVYITKYHAVKYENDFYSPYQMGVKKVEIDDNPTYYHLQLECKENENRRTNTLIVNGIQVESYSKEII
jgi:hypothetical protein